MALGTAIVRGRLLVLALWLAGAAALGFLVKPVDPRLSQPDSFLPKGTPCNVASAAMRESFPVNSGLSEAVIVFERSAGPLRPADLEYIEQMAGAISQPGDIADSEDLTGTLIRSPRSFVLKPNPLMSETSDLGQAALVTVGIPANFITLRSDRIVDHIHATLSRQPLPAGLRTSVTGSSGFGHDYADAAEASHAQTLRVTLVAVIVILLLVYRSPVAASVPLAAISLAAFAAMKVLDAAQHLGMQVGTAERIFVTVLLYGAGVDYSLFFISRFREFLNEGRPSPSAVAAAVNATCPAILASASTDAAGLMMLCFADYGIFRTTGPAVAVALLVALLAAVTLVPAMVSLAGRRMFWPMRPSVSPGAALGVGRRRLWPNVARVVIAHPALVLVVLLALLVAPASQGLRGKWVYDTLTELRMKPDAKIGNAAVGIEMVKRHWPVGQIAPVHVLVRSGSAASEKQWNAMADRLTRALLKLPEIESVRSLTRPLGEEPSDLAGMLVKQLGAKKVLSEYLSGDRRSMRMAVILGSRAFSSSAMRAVERIREVLVEEVDRSVLAEAVGREVHIAGATAEMMDMRTVTQADFRRVAALSLIVVFTIVLVLLRDAALSGFMVASTVLSYFATLGVSWWVFVGLMGQDGLDWKVEVFLFVVMIAVGVDYNILLSSRLAQEASRLPVKPAAARAVIHTGPVISSCGLIMAATLGSLMAGELQLLRQLGFALSVGMLIDTFIIRPLLLPAFVALTGRTGRATRGTY